MKAHYNVLFLCTGNSARSIMAEAILNFKGRPHFTGYSAGSQTSGAVRPEALRELEMAHIPTEGLRSKAWDEFSLPGSPPLDFVFTVWDNAARGVCRVWPGQPMSAPLGRSGPSGSSRKRSGSGTSVPRGIHHLASQNQSISLPSTEEYRQPRAQEGARQHRPDDDTCHSSIAAGFGKGAAPGRLAPP
jgi:protein-tyrosine-phosphatase